MTGTKGRKQAKLMLREPGEAKGVLDLDGENSKKLTQPLIREVPDAFAAAEKAGQFEFVTFDPGRKHLARVVAVNGKKVTVRRFNKKTGEWQTKNESREREACIPLTAAEAEASFPGCVAAWEAAANPPGAPAAGAKPINEDNPNAAALVAAFKKNDRDMEAWRKEAAPMVKALENDLEESGEIWYGGKRYTSIKKWCEPALGIKYRAMRYRLTGGNPVSKRKGAGATVAPKAVTLKRGLVVKLEIGDQLYVITEEPAINEKDGTRSFTLMVNPYEESKPASTKPKKDSRTVGQTATHRKQGRHPAAEMPEAVKVEGAPGTKLRVEAAFAAYGEKMVSKKVFLRIHAAVEKYRDYLRTQRPPVPERPENATVVCEGEGKPGHGRGMIISTSPEYEAWEAARMAAEGTPEYLAWNKEFTLVCDLGHALIQRYDPLKEGDLEGDDDDPDAGREGDDDEEAL